jgi:alpha-L-fucosidase
MFAALSALIAMSGNVSFPPATPTPVPTPAQLRWQKMEYYGFVHFGPNTFSGQEWGDGRENPDSFNPTQLDTRQWVRTFKNAGMTGIIITAKHHDGFCLWPSQYSTHTVKESRWRNGQGDVLREISRACREEGLKLGVYLSPWDRNHPSYGTPAYNVIFARMLKEVLTNYGPIFEVWFDGANGEGPNGKKQEYDWDLFIRTVRERQPQAVIFSDAGPDVRWVGNEQGYAGETNWSTIKRSRYVPGTPLYKELTSGDAEGTDWVPAECDVSIRPGWFWRAAEDAKVKTPGQLLDIYLGSVGRNGTLLLNVPPDSRGLIHPNDVKALMEFRQLRDAWFANDLARGRLRGEQIRFGSPTEVDTVVLEEEIAKGQRVSGFAVWGEVDGSWKRLTVGTTIGYRRILTFPRERVTGVMVKVFESRATPLPIRVKLYRRP